MPNELFVGVVTYNNLPLIKKCCASWLGIPGSVVMIFDNGSYYTTVSFLRELARQHDNLYVFHAKSNHGLCVGRNRLLEHCRDAYPEIEYTLLIDSDVLIHEGSAQQMVDAMRLRPEAGFVGYEQANQAFKVGNDGFVEEISSECALSRMAMWREVGMLPESLMYYSSDSWKSTICNMHGWRTFVIHDIGYTHFAHGSQVNQGVVEMMERDITLWQAKERTMIAYWTKRLRLGKGYVEPLDYSI